METCKKKTFKTREEAVKRVVFIQTQGEKREKNPKRAYKCTECGLWHLTSISSRKWKHVVLKYGTIEERKLKSEADFWINKKGWEIDE